MRRDRPLPPAPVAEGTLQAQKTLEDERRATARTLRSVRQEVSMAEIRQKADRVVVRIAIGIGAAVGLMLLVALIHITVAALD
jgi:hypothetical protein